MGPAGSLQGRLATVEAALRLQDATGASHLQQIEINPEAYGVAKSDRPHIKRLRLQRNRALHGAKPAEEESTDSTTGREAPTLPTTVQPASENAEGPGQVPKLPPRLGPDQPGRRRPPAEKAEKAENAEEAEEDPDYQAYLKVLLGTVNGAASPAAQFAVIDEAARYIKERWPNRKPKVMPADDVSNLLRQLLPGLPSN